MIRIQIIIFSLLSVLLLSLLTGDNGKQYSSDYELGFVCSLKLEVSILPSEIEINSSGEEDKFFKLAGPAVINHNTQLKIVSSPSALFVGRSEYLVSSVFEDIKLQSTTLPYLLSPRSPPYLV